ncbi:MAG: RNA polymerase sigma factor [bacterium]|nr:RNA polymerase sigma factor [bacterium]
MEIEQIVDRYYQKIYKLCLFYLKDKDEAEELLQEIFIKVLKKKSSFKGESELYTWLYRIAVNTLINHIKRQKIVRFVSFDSLFETKADTPPANHPDPALTFERRELHEKKLQILEKCLENLSHREKTAFYFFHYDKLRHKEIAEIMNTSVSAVEALVHKGMTKLKKCAKHH